EFVLRSTLRAHDLETVEGRVAALRASAPVVAGIRDAALRPEYARMLAGWLGMELDAVRQAVAAAGRQGASPGGGGGRGGDASRATDAGREPSIGSGRDPEPRLSARLIAPDRGDPVARLERNALEAVLQHPEAVDAPAFDALPDDAFTVPAFRAVHDAIRAAGGLASGLPGWAERVREEAAGPVLDLVTELAVSPLPEDRPDAIEDYVRGVVEALVDLGLTRQIAARRGSLQRMDPVARPGEYGAAFAELVALENRRRSQRERD
ncbi:MAG TPA: DNA primase, partial [Actinotalea sp.]|nr:DNA primase [Actinotalea sp.]